MTIGQVQKLKSGRYKIHWKKVRAFNGLVNISEDLRLASPGKFSITITDNEAVEFLADVQKLTPAKRRLDQSGRRGFYEIDSCKRG